MATITVPGMFLTGDHASRPAFGDVGIGTLYSCTDHDLIYQSDGAAWGTWATVGGGGSLGSLQTYTPAWTSSGSAPSIGDGTLAGRYRLLDATLMHLLIYFQRGSTSTNGTGSYQYSLPSGYKTKNTGGVIQVGSAAFNDQGTAFFVCQSYIAANATAISILVADASGTRVFGDGTPVTLANGDAIHINMLLEVETV